MNKISLETLYRGLGPDDEDGNDDDNMSIDDPDSGFTINEQGEGGIYEENK